MVEIVALVNAVLAILPPGIIFFLAYGPYDGAFRDQTVFLFFMGGLLLGGFLGFLSLFLYATDASALIQVAGLALLYPIATVAAINRRRWQGERHAIFNGGAMGLGTALMMSFAYLYRLFGAQEQLDAATIGQAILLSTALAGTMFGIGLIAGNGVRQRHHFRAAFTGTALLLLPLVAMREYLIGRAWLWLILLAIFGLTFAILAERRLLSQGASDEARRDRRRKRRAETRE